jgi:hypothetical protein
VLRVWDSDGALLQCTTDPAGQCNLPIQLSEQWLCVNVASPDKSAEHGDFRAFVRAQDGELLVRWGRGPLVQAEFSPPTEHHAAELVYGLRSRKPGALTSPPLAVGPTVHARIWNVQLPSQASRLSELDALVLHVATPDGLLGAQASLAREALSLKAPLSMEFCARAALSVELSALTEELSRSNRIRLSRPGDPDGWIASPNAAGPTWMPNLDPGNYHLEIIAPGFADWTRELELRGGVHERIVAQLERAEKGAPVRGRVVRARDAYDGSVIMALQDGQQVQFRRLNWSECAEGFEARFEFPAVGAARGVLQPIAIDGLPSFEPALLDTSGAESEVEFRCLGTRRAQPISCDVRCMDSNEAILGLEFEFELAGGATISYRQSASSSAAEPRWSVSSHNLQWKVRSGSPLDWLDEARALRWKLAAPGFESTSGDQRDLSWEGLLVRMRRKPAADEH